MQSNSHFLNRDLLKLNLRYHHHRFGENEEAIESKESISRDRERKEEEEKTLTSISGTLCLLIGIGRLNKPRRGKKRVVETATKAERK